MTNNELVKKLKTSEKFKTWIKTPYSVEFVPDLERQIVYVAFSDANVHFFLYAFMLFDISENRWEISVDVSNGTISDIITAVLRRR